MLTHGDIAMCNSKPTLHDDDSSLSSSYSDRDTVMLGDDLGFPDEHRTALVGLKLIDFGMARFVYLAPTAQSATDTRS